ncbi:MAG TPA: 2OG-Fe(II) oxygenase [Pyrinomonadaceae bacterium]|jgi:hypothetical protein|nr:2OG-Fe(II) oxygenase [Pyrinomonadaceae bacterium]
MSEISAEMDFEKLTLEQLAARAPALAGDWEAGEPFRFVIIDNFLHEQFAEDILAAYPVPDVSGWDSTTYIHQRKKLTQRSNFPPPIERFFTLTASREFRDLIGEICGIRKLIDDPELVGGGLHQILRGGFLDVHVDYNLHPKTKLHRRLNLLLYLNKDWRPEYEGYLEFWDFGSERQLERVAPLFNRGVIFETNEVSYHGHPQPLNTPPHITRKSLAIYYYTEERDDNVVADEHNTLYRQTTGARGLLKTLASGATAMQERLTHKGVGALGRNLVNRTYRRIQGLPPENKAE